MALMLRAELFEPGLQIMRPEFSNQQLLLNGLIMIFSATMPAFCRLRELCPSLDAVDIASTSHFPVSDRPAWDWR
jgi:heme/copper-type cytochrome/quinol oxidase subunit 1